VNKKVAMRTKSVLFDCLIATIFFLLLTALTSQTALAGTPGAYYVTGANNNGSSTYYGVTGYQTTVSVYVTNPQSSMYSFVTLIKQTPFQQFAIGTLQGRDPGGVWQSTPVYYVDRVLNGVLGYWQYGQAPIGQNHYYYVFCDGTGSTISASIDGVIKRTESGYATGGKQASGQTEAHNTDDVMNHHFWGMQYRPVESRWFSFYNTLFHQDSPFHYNSISNTEWYAYK
jgi:hypothetical protein